MYVYEIPFPPVAWASHRGYGRKSFNPHYKEKEAAQWHLKKQHGSRPLFAGAIRADFFFEMPIPKSMPKKILKRIESGEKIFHSKRPDATNFRKHSEDCLTGTVWIDDGQVACGETQKYYSTNPRTLIHIQELEVGQ